MLSSTAENKMFTLDGGGGTSIFGQGQPYFWGTRAITPNDPMPGLFKWLKETYPDAKTIGFVGWDIGEPNNGIIKEDILKKIADGGYELNGLYELVPVGGQDFSQVLPKIKANEPDILLVGIYGQDPGSFANQAATAGLKAPRIFFEFTPDGVNASKGTYDSDGFTFAYDYFDPKNPTSPLAKKFVEDFNADNGEDPDFYAANFYENAFVMWELMRRIWAKDPEAEITRRGARRRAAGEPHRRQRLRRRRLDARHLHPRPEDPLRARSARWACSSTRAARSPRRRSSASTAPTTTAGLSRPHRNRLEGAVDDAGSDLRDVPPTDRRRLLPRLQLRPARGGLRAHPRRDRAVPLRLRVHVHARRLPGVHVRRSGGEWPFWPSAILGDPASPASSARGSSAACTARSPATPAPPRCWPCSSPPSASASPARTSSGSTSGANTKAYFGPRKTPHEIWDAHLHQLRLVAGGQRASPSRWPSPRCCGTPASAARSRRPASTPTSPRRSASTPTGCT